MKRQKSGGRKKGTPNKATSTLKDAILVAAEQVGADGKGADGLTGYLRRVAIEDIKAFASLLGRVLPLQVTGADGGPIEHSVTSDAERFTGSIASLAARDGADEAAERTQH